MEISDILKQAWDAVEKSGVPKEIQAPAFKAAILLLTPVPLQQGDPTKTQKLQDTPKSLTGNRSEDEFYDRVIERTNVDKADLEKLVYLDDGEPRLVAGSIKGSLTTAESIRFVAHVLAVVRTLGLGQQGVSVKLIRAECDRLNRNDEKNFKRHLKKIENFTFTTKDKIEFLIPRPAAFDSFPAVIGKLLGVAS